MTIRPSFLILVGFFLALTTYGQGLKDLMYNPADQAAYDFAAQEDPTVLQSIKTEAKPGPAGAIDLTRTVVYVNEGIKKIEKFRISANGMECWHMSTTLIAGSSTVSDNRRYLALKYPSTGLSSTWNAPHGYNTNSVAMQSRITEASNPFILIHTFSAPGDGVLYNSTYTYSRRSGLSKIEITTNPGSTLTYTSIGKSPTEAQRSALKRFGNFLVTNGNSDPYLATWALRALRNFDVQYTSKYQAGKLLENIDKLPEVRRAIFGELLRERDPSLFLSRAGMDEGLAREVVAFLNSSSR